MSKANIGEETKAGCSLAPSGYGDWDPRKKEEGEECCSTREHFGGVEDGRGHLFLVLYS